MTHRAPVSDFSRRIMFNRTWDLLGNRWKFYIVYLLADGPMRFGQLCRHCSAVSRPTFTACLRALEQEGFLERRILEGNALAVEYRLAPLGQSAAPCVVSLVEWGFREEPETEEAR